jgi:alpha-tubulin suppressor-like RCC1 family protein
MSSFFIQKESKRFLFLLCLSLLVVSCSRGFTLGTKASMNGSQVVIDSTAPTDNNADVQFTSAFDSDGNNLAMTWTAFSDNVAVTDHRIILYTDAACSTGAIDMGLTGSAIAVDNGVVDSVPDGTYYSTVTAYDAAGNSTVSACSTDTISSTVTKKFRVVESGHFHSCGITSLGNTFCWGNNTYGQLGDNTTIDRSLPVAIDTTNLSGGETFVSLSLGSGHSCGVTSLKNTFCWGLNSSGQLGDNTTTNSSLPIAVDLSNLAAGEKIILVSLGSSHNCGVTNIGNTFCWGNNTYGQLGDNTGIAKQRPTAVDMSNLGAGETFVSVSLGYLYSCGNTSLGKTFCWGINSHGNLGDNTVIHKSLPTAVDTTNLSAGETFVSISAGSNHTCGITSIGNTFCWGRNNSGQLGDNTAVNSSLPIAVDLANLTNGEKFVSVSSGLNINCGVSSLGNTFCWGLNTYGQLGDNTIISRSLPTAVNTTNLASGEKFISLSLGYSYSCGITSFGNTFSWGRNDFGQLANNTTTDSLTPTEINNSSI